jgi:hypothetical protein
MIAGESVCTEKMPPEVFFGDKASVSYSSRRWTVQLEDGYVATSVGLCRMPGKHVRGSLIAQGYERKIQVNGFLGYSG